MSDDNTLLIQRIIDGSIDKSKDLIKANLSKANLSRAELSEAELSRTNLSRAILSDANFCKANLSDANLSRANLSRANLSEAELSRADFSRAKLRRADLSKAILFETELSDANLSGADLSRAILRANLSRANLSRAILSKTNLSDANLSDANLSKANLSKANLSRAELSDTNLNRANLNQANLNQANLTRTQALGTDFTGAILTGICIEDWHINSDTKLDGVICEYVYLKRFEQERRPHSGTFAPGDFAKLVQSSLETIDLIFREGLDWNAFAYAFKQIEVHYEDAQLAVQTIENKGDGVVIVKIATSPNTDKEEIHSYFINGYDLASKALAAQYETRLQDKDKYINSLILIVENLSGVTKAMAESKSGDNINFNQQGATIGGVAGKMESGSRIDITQTINQGEKQSLAEAAAEIQRLLTQLEVTNPTATESEQVSYVNAAIKPDLRKRTIAALKAGTETAIDEFVLENKFLKVGKAIAKGWLEAGS